MKKMFLFAVSATICLFLLATAQEINQLDARQWKQLPSVVDKGTGKISEGTLQLTAAPSGGGLYYCLDQKLPVGKNTEASVKFEWRGKTVNPKDQIIATFFVYNNQGKYQGRAIPGKNLNILKNGYCWGKKVFTTDLSKNMKDVPDGFVKFVFNLQQGASAEIRKFKLTMKERAVAQNTRQFTIPEPLTIRPANFPVGKGWSSRSVGEQDFYLMENGNYNRFPAGQDRHFYETGIFPFMAPGLTPMEVFSNEKTQERQTFLAKTYLDKKSPIWTVLYQRCYGNPPPDENVVNKINSLWIGDGQPEEMIYRLDPVFHYFETGEKWHGSSSSIWQEKPYLEYFRKELMPALQRVLPGCDKPDYVWDRANLKILRDTYCLTYCSVNLRPLCWTMFLSPYAIAEKHQGVCSIAAKGQSSFNMAILRGVARQSGSSKFLQVSLGHEPTDLYRYCNIEFYSSPIHENWGYPLIHLNYYFFRPYLTGVNGMTCESFPFGLVRDPEQNNTWELTGTGRIIRQLEDYIIRNPKRGIPYTPAVFFYGPDRAMYFKDYFDRIAYDEADWSNYAMINDLLLPEHRHTRNTGGYSNVTSFGELLDIMQVAHDWDKVATLDGYRLLIAGAGADFSVENGKAIRAFVNNGGILAINAADISNVFDHKFTGVQVEGEPFTASEIHEVKSGKLFREKPFSMLSLELKGARSLYTAEGKPAVTIHPFGKGQVVVTAPKYMVSDEYVDTIESNHHVLTSRPLLLNFTKELFDRLFETITPFSVRVAPENRADFTWNLNKKEEEWELAVYNYSLEKEMKIRAKGTAKTDVIYPYKSIPFEITAHVPVSDVVEQYEGRDVNFQRIGGKLTVQEAIRSGEIQVYRFSPHKIILPEYQTRVNYALNCPVKATSSFKEFTPNFITDGRIDNNDFWQSDVNKAKYYSQRSFILPQSATVDLSQVRELEGIKLVFHSSISEEPDARRQVVRYVISGSLDEKNWKVLRDEQANIMPVHPGGIEFFFPADNFQYIKLDVVFNSVNSGAQIVELQCLGKEKITVSPVRKSGIPKHVVKFPEEMENLTQITYLRELKPLFVKPGWMPTGKKWEQLNGFVKLYAEIDGSEGLDCPQSLYGESTFSAEYAIPAGSQYFASVCGFGAKHRLASVEFKVFVDNILKYDSGIFRIGQRLLPVCVDVTGGKVLKLVTSDGKDGGLADYAWWGDARFVR